MGDTQKRSCVECKTSKTPLWRGGPAGPKTLCNACGIRYRKRKFNQLFAKQNEELKSSLSHTSSLSDHRTNFSSTRDSDQDEAWRLMEMEVHSSVKRKKSRKLGEEEQAAVLLMALSCGSVFA